MKDERIQVHSYQEKRRAATIVVGYLPSKRMQIRVMGSVVVNLVYAEGTDRIANKASMTNSAFRDGGRNRSAK